MKFIALLYDKFNKLGLMNKNLLKCSHRKRVKYIINRDFVKYMNEKFTKYGQYWPFVIFLLFSLFLFMCIDFSDKRVLAYYNRTSIILCYSFILIMDLLLGFILVKLYFLYKIVLYVEVCSNIFFIFLIPFCFILTIFSLPFWELSFLIYNYHSRFG